MRVKRFVDTVRNRLFKRFYYDKNGKPKRCFECGSTKFEDVTVQMEEGGYVSIYDVLCIRCGFVASTNVYGNYDTRIFEPEPWMSIIKCLLNKRA